MKQNKMEQLFDISQGVDTKGEISLYDHDGNLKIVPMINPADGCSFWRILKPFEAMGLHMEDDKKSLIQHLETCKAVTFNRAPGIKPQQFLELKAKYGFKIIIDWDDWFHLPHDHLIYNDWVRNRMPEIAEEFIKSCADYVTVTTDRLATKMRTLGKEVVVFPNAIPLTDPQFVSDPNRTYGEGRRELTRSGKIVDTFGTRFGYVAGSSHLPDLKHVAPVFNHFPDLKFSLCGYDNPGERRGAKNVWDQMERICSFNYHNQNYRRVKTMGFNDYARCYDGIDVAIAPLKKNNFNQYKSSLKAYEAGAKRVALICSDNAPYSDDLPRDVVTFCESNADWVDAIKKHKDVNFAADQANKLHEWVVANRDIKKISAQRLEWLNSIL